MKDYNGNFEFDLIDNFNLKDKIKKYFEVYNFELLKDENNNLVFVKKWSLLNGWRINPLNWETEINIKLSEKNKTVINHTVISNGFLTPIAFTSLFKSFLLNLEKFINQNIDFKEKNSPKIKLAKEKVLKYHGLLIIGILLGLVFGIILSNLTGMKLFGTVGIIVGAITSEKFMNQYLIKNNTLQHRV